MKLNIAERLTLLNVLPEQGDFTTLRIVHQLRQDLSFGEEETKEFGLEVLNEGQQVRWAPERDREVEFDIGPKACAIIADRLRELDSEKELKEAHVSLYEKFVLTGDE